MKIDGCWRMLPVVKIVEKSSLRYDFTRVMADGAAVPAPAGTFYLEYREDGRKVRRAIGDDVLGVKAALSTQGTVLHLRAMGVEADDAPQIGGGARPIGRTIRTVVAEFAKAESLEYRRRSFLKYRNALESFQAWTGTVRGGKTHVSQVGRQDIKTFMAHLVRERGLDVSTAVDKGVIVAKVLRDAGAPIQMQKGDWPKVTERRPEVYKPEQLRALFQAAGDRDFVRYQAFLQTGLREQELAHLAWENFDAKRGVVSVRKKRGFDPKTYQERDVPVPAELVQLLEEHCVRQLKETGRAEYYIFPTSRTHNRGKGASGGQADRHMLDKLKLLAYEAGLNCKRCQGTFRGKVTTCAKAPICGEWGLHKFRHTYATTMLRDGVDLKSLQLLLGHKDLASTEKYLRALEPEDLLEKVRKTSIATRFR